MRLLKQLFRRLFGTRTLFVDLADNHARLRARGFDLVDENDRVVAMLQLAPGGGADFILRDAAGRPSVKISAGSNGPRLSVFDPCSGKIRAMLDVDPESQICSFGVLSRFGDKALLKQAD